MNKPLRPFILCLLAATAISLGGCSVYDKTVASLASPNTSKAAANIKTVATAVICTLDRVAATALGVEKAIAAQDALTGKPVNKDLATAQDVTFDFYVATNAACAALGGVNSGTTTNVPAAAVVAVSAK